MGGYGSGGSNRKKNTIERFKKVDSYDNHVAELLSSIVIEKSSGATVRRYFVCPACHKTVRYLYIVGKRLVCRRCAGANYAIQQMSRDDLAVERAKKIFAKLQVDISDMCPMDFMQYRSEIKRPKGMNPEEYCKLIRKLREQQKIWLDCLMRILR